MGNIFKKQTEFWSLNIDDEKAVFRKEKSIYCKKLYFSDLPEKEAAYLKAHPEVLLKAFEKYT